MIEQTLVALIKFRASQERLSGKENVDYKLIVYSALTLSWTLSLVWPGILIIKLFYIHPLKVLLGALPLAVILAIIHAREVLKGNKVEKLRNEILEAEESQVKKSYRYGLIVLGAYLSVPFLIALLVWLINYYYYS